MIFKPLFALLAAGCLCYLLLRTDSVVRRLAAAVLFGGGIICILNPDLTSRIAHLVGVGRGTDLVLYLTTLFLCFVSFTLHLRLRRLDERCNDLVRELAIRFPVQSDDDGGVRS